MTKPCRHCGKPVEDGPSVQYCPDCLDEVVARVAREAATYRHAKRITKRGDVDYSHYAE